MFTENAKQPLSRRDLLVAVGIGVVAATGLILLPDLVSATEANVEKAIADKLGGTVPKEGKITLEVPEAAENGASVQFTVTVDNPMTDKDYVKEIHVFTEGNPTPLVASYYFTPRSGKASVTARMRLAQKQHVRALAVMSNGSAYVSRKEVNVTVGGCGS